VAKEDEAPNRDKSRPEPYDLYRRWFDALESARGGAAGDTAGSAELEELWKRWFEVTLRPWSGTAEAKDGSQGSMAALWSEMAKDASTKMTSGEGLPEDPLRSFVQWYEDTKTKWSEEADEILRKDEVLEQGARHLEAGARSYDELRRASEQGLKRLQVPTRSDVSRVAKLVMVVENKVDRIEEALEDFIYGDAELATAGAVSNLEERMDRLEGKMDRILASLKRFEAGEEPGPEASPQPTSERNRRPAGEASEGRGNANSIEANTPGYS
jgi:polyhydroxyalkanoic acid synthase PhaR subunit